MIPDSSNNPVLFLFIKLEDFFCRVSISDSLVQFPINSVNDCFAWLNLLFYLNSSDDPQAVEAM
jgi:hypothetical protein